MELENVLAQLAEKFGTTVEHLWGVMVYQAKIDAVTTIAALAIGWVITIFVIIWGTRKARAPETDTDTVEWMLLEAGCLISLVFVVVFSFTSINYVATAIFNPEYYALKMVFEVLRQ